MAIEKVKVQAGRDEELLSQHVVEAADDYVSCSPHAHSPGLLVAARRSPIIFKPMASHTGSTFTSGRLGVGKSTFLRSLFKTMEQKGPRACTLFFVAPTGSAAKTADAQKYHSFFIFSRDYTVYHMTPAKEAARLLSEDSLRPIAPRLALVRVFIFDEVSTVPADTFSVICELLRQSRWAAASAFLVYAFWDCLQLGPFPGGALAFTSSSWKQLFGRSILELTLVLRQSDVVFISGIIDALYGVCSPSLKSLMKERTITKEE